MIQRDLYLDLMIRCLTNTIYEDPPTDPWADGKYILANRLNGTDWPSLAHTMIGVQRLQNIRLLSHLLIQENIPGDFIETGVWRGGATIFMRAILKAYGVYDKNVWVADSFEGLPKPSSDYPADADDIHHTHAELAVSLEQVKVNFSKYGLLDDRVKFLKGWFKDTLPNAPIKKLALMRLDGDMYESTMDSLEALYPKLSKGGFVIFDDANSVPACQKAILDFRDKYSIEDHMYRTVDDIGVYWRKT